MPSPTLQLTLLHRVNTTYGVYSAAFIENNYYNASQLDYAWVGGLSASVAVVVGPLANWMIQRMGMKPPMLIGAVCVGLGQCMAGLCKSYGPFLFCQGIL